MLVYFLVKVVKIAYLESGFTRAWVFNYWFVIGGILKVYWWIRKLCNNCHTAWKVSNYGVISGSYFPVFWLNTGKYGPEIIPYLDTFHAVSLNPV